MTPNLSWSPDSYSSEGYQGYLLLGDRGRFILFRYSHGASVMQLGN